MNPTQFVNRSKKAPVDWSKEMLQKYDRDASKHVYDIVTDDESWTYSCSRTKHFQANDRLFFGKTRHVEILPLEHHRTVNSEWYTTICLSVVFQEIRKTNRRRRITRHHDNASFHTSAQTTAFCIDLMSYLLYSPDLTQNDFFLFPYLKKNEKSMFFDT